MSEELKAAQARIACLEGEIAKRDEELAACRVAVENCEMFRARIVELESRYQRDVFGLNNEGDPIGGDPAGGYANDNAHLRAELSAIKAQEPIGWYTEDHLDDKSATTYSWTVAERWVEKGWPVSPLYAAPVSEAKAHGVVMPAELDRAFITSESCDGVYRVAIQSETLKEMQAVHNWLARLNATPVQQVSVPDGWRDGYRAAMNSAASGARQLYVQHCHHHGVNGLLDRCKELEQSFIRDADAAASAAPAAPAADAGHVFYGMDGNHP